ncbi:SUMF1/EgtB/PvdO family nonheme iron enzyme [Clostridium sp. MD294]|uniref:formylglycine-generating enzyme family protein n=1 Tax=Clostridium sp. MD294 TaxID=97138 RepID=UPI0002CAC467|nr:SUMF1/EgtB/PvdO family nonheme iron enzyme [Clostridium sp. MD294]NDO47010.1 SUMF1/EgtB/PvdOfamily nonheme iron enzyme [Clostridium sp. MD294]USF31239.1 hypothetical protein C820_002685 [Clostridium sp. MD294]
MKKALSFIVSVITMLSFSLTACTATNTKTEVKTNTSTAKQINDNFILINDGTFQMGSPTNESERESDEIQHKVMVNSFYMSKTELSQKEYKDVMENNPSESKGDTLSVENVTWYDAI